MSNAGNTTRVAAVAEKRARLVVGIGEMKVSSDVDESIMTYALGSCIGVCIYDPVARVGGLLHAMLPDSSTSPERATREPFAFVDTGVPRLFRACYALGAQKPRIQLTVAGGAAMKQFGVEEDLFQIGKRNVVALRQILWKNGVLIHKHELGGSISRTITMSIVDGSVRVASNGIERPIGG